MKLLFDTNGNEKQKQVCRYWIDEHVTDIVYGGSKGSGKSYLGASLIFGDALTYPNTHYFISRKKLNDLRKYTVPTIHEVFEHWELTDYYYRFDGKDNYFNLYNDSKVYLIEAKYMPSDPQYMRFGSMQMTRGMIEEAGEFERDAKENLQASIGRWKNDKYRLPGKLLQTCNPSKNYLYPDYYKKHKKGELEEYKRFVQAFPEDNKMLDKGYLESLNRILSKNAKERLLKGNWEYDDDPSALCDYEKIVEVFENDHLKIDEEEKSKAKKYLTADVARMGSDKAIILAWENYNVIDGAVFEVSKTTLIQEAINTLRQKYKIPKSQCIADEDGVGGGVVDNCGIRGFVNNSKPHNDENYKNLQTQCAYKLAEKINESGIWFQWKVEGKYKDEIIQELEQLKSYNEDKETKLQVLPKEQIKNNIGRSPDWRDVLLMRFYFREGTGKYSVS